MTGPAYRTILVPLDGSALSERALPEATALAARSGARLLLLRVAVANFVTRNDPLTGEPRLADLAADYLRDVAARAGDRSAAETIEAAGEPGPVIGRVARERGVDLIVMATHGRSGIGRWLYGSVADYVLRHAPVPVLLVSPHCERPWTAEGVGVAGRVLVPLDGSQVGAAALGPAVDLAATLGTGLLLAQVVAYPPYTGYGYGGALEVAPYAFDPETERVAAERYLDAAAAPLRRAGCDVATCADLGPAAPTVARLARERGAVAIAMATHGRGGLARAVLGSVATGVVQLAGVPVLLTRPAAAPAAPVAPATAARREGVPER